MSRWIQDLTGEQLDDDQLGQLRERAHRLYEANVHIFEDEDEAVLALGVVRARERGTAGRGSCGPPWPTPTRRDGRRSTAGIRV